MNKNIDKIYDIAIIGAGPIGLFATFQAGMLSLSSVIIDAREEIGGQCSALYPKKPIYDIPGYPKILAEDLIQNLSKQANRFTPDYHLGIKITEVKKNDDNIFILTGLRSNLLSKSSELEIFTDLSSNNESKIINKINKDNTSQNNNSNNKSLYNIYAKTVIIATGGGSLDPKKLPIENAKTLENKNIFYSIKDLNMFKNKDVLIAGGGDSAVDWALNIIELNLNNKTYVAHRRDKFTAIPSNVEEMKSILKHKSLSYNEEMLIIGYNIKEIEVLHENILQIHTDYKQNDQNVDQDQDTNQDQHINQDMQKYQNASLSTNKLLITLEKINSINLTNQVEKKIITVDYLLPFYGLQQDVNFMSSWGIALDKGDILVNEFMETNIKGLFAAGDCIIYNTKLKLILSGFSEVSIACHAIYKYINGSKPKHEYSTSKMM